MAHQLPFELHVTSVLGIPDIGDNHIQYRAPTVIKLEAGTNAIVNTGVTISNCCPHGLIRVSICDKYHDLISITQNIFNPYHNQVMSVCLYNPTDQYIRINTDEKIFKYDWIPSDEPLTKDSYTQTDTIDKVDEQAQTDPIVVDPVTIDLDSIDEFVVEEATPMDSDEHSTSIDMEQSAGESEDHSQSLSSDQMIADENSVLEVTQEPTNEVVSIDNNDAPTTVEPVVVAAPKRTRRVIKKKVL